MNVDTDTLSEIRRVRVQTDPLIPHPGKEDWLKSSPGTIHDLVEIARKSRLNNAPVSKPIQKATWPETTIFCFTRSMDERIDQHAHLGAYQHCFDQMATGHLGKSFDEMIGGSMEIVTTDGHRELAENFREYIAAAQHHHFVEQQYDELSIKTTGVPKAFWRSVISNGDSGTNSENTGNQVTLHDY